MKFEIGDVLEYKVDSVNFKSVLLSVDIEKKKILLLAINSRTDFNIYNENYSYDWFGPYTKIGHIDLSELFMEIE